MRPPIDLWDSYNVVRFNGASSGSCHENAGSGIERLLSVYAHTNPHPKIEAGVTVKEGDIIATLASTSHSKANILPHLHFSLWHPLKSISYDGFIWNTIRNPEMITLLDPLPVVDWPYRELEAGDSTCREI